MQARTNTRPDVQWPNPHPGPAPEKAGEKRSTMTQPITNDWIETVKRLRTENNDLRQNLFVIRLAWAAYGFMGGLGIAAILYAVTRG